MNSAKRSVSCAAFLGLMLMMSATANAEYSLGSYNSSANSPSINTDVLKPAGLALSGDRAGADAALEAKLRASLEKTGEIIKRSNEEVELRGKVDGANQTIASRQKAILGIKKAESDAVKRIIDKNKADLNQINSLASAAGNTGADLKAPEEASCKSGVDFSAAKAMADTMGSAPIQYLKSEAESLVNEENKEAKAKRTATIAKLFDTIEKFQGDNKQVEQFATPIQKLDLTKGDNSLATGVNQLKAEWDDQRVRRLPDLDNQLKKANKDAVLGAVALDENATDADFVKLKTQTAASMRNHLKLVKAQFRQAGDQLLVNCEKNIDQLGRGNPLGASSWTNSAYQFAAKISPSFANTTLLPMLNQMTQDAQCTDVSQGIETLFGAQMEQAINTVESARDRKTLISTAFATTNAISSSQAQIGTVMRPLIDDCDRTARDLKKVKDYVGQVKSQTEQNAQANQNGQPGQPNRSRGQNQVAGANGRPNGQTHTPTQPQRRI